MTGRAPIRAAGVVALSAEGTVVLIRRERRSDVSLPKGKLERDELSPVAAVRECLEETGLTVRLGMPLGALAYDVDGVPKTVDYWHALVVGDAGFVPNDEVAAVLHLSIADAVEQLSYRRDAELLARAAGLAPTRPFVVLRHAAATARDDWAASAAADAADDAARPLSPLGLRQSERLVALLAAYGVTDVRTSSARRCRQTVEPYAVAAGLHAAPDDRLSEEAHAQDTDGVGAAVREALDSGEPVVLCTHRPVLREVVRVLRAELDTAPGLDLAAALDPQLATAAMLVLHRDPQGLVVAVEQHHVD